MVFALKTRYDLNCVKSAVKLQPTNQPTNSMSQRATAGDNTPSFTGCV